jgi:hypothetical protein
MHTKFWFVNLKGRDHSEDVGVDNIRMHLREKRTVIAQSV